MLLAPVLGVKRPDGAFYSRELHEFILPYDTVRRTVAPEQAVLQFLESTYAAAADLGHWDRAVLERLASRGEAVLGA